MKTKISLETILFISVQKCFMQTQAYACVLVCSGCYNKNIINWVTHKQQVFSSHSLEGGKSKIVASGDLVSGENSSPGS